MDHPQPLRSGLRLCSLVLMLGMLAGCSSSPDSTRLAATWPHAEFERTPMPPPPASTIDPSNEASPAATDDQVPPDDPSIPRVDVNGSQPDEVVLDLVDACNNAEWTTAYSLYANPEVDRPAYIKEMDAAREVLRDFTIFESRVMDEDSAAVRVGYSIPATGQAEPIVIEAPGEWWGLSLVDGEWKVNWLPRQ